MHTLLLLFTILTARIISILVLGDEYVFNQVSIGISSRREGWLGHSFLELNILEMYIFCYENDVFFYFIKFLPGLQKKISAGVSISVEQTKIFPLSAIMACARLWILGLEFDCKYIFSHSLHRLNT